MSSRQARWQKKKHAENIAAGKCRTCGEDPTPGYATCAKCRKAKRKYQRDWYQRNRSAKVRNVEIIPPLPSPEASGQ